jgi:hypothetical protein
MVTVFECCGCILRISLFPFSWDRPPFAEEIATAEAIGGLHRSSTRNLQNWRTKNAKRIAIVNPDEDHHPWPTLGLPQPLNWPLVNGKTEDLHRLPILDLRRRPKPIDPHIVRNAPWGRPRLPILDLQLRPKPIDPHIVRNAPWGRPRLPILDLRMQLPWRKKNEIGKDVIVVDLVEMIVVDSVETIVVHHQWPTLDLLQQ